MAGRHPRQALFPDAATFDQARVAASQRTALRETIEEVKNAYSRLLRLGTTELGNSNIYSHTQAAQEPLAAQVATEVLTMHVERLLQLSEMLHHQRLLYDLAANAGPRKAHAQVLRDEITKLESQLPDAARADLDLIRSRFDDSGVKTTAPLTAAEMPAATNISTAAPEPSESMATDGD
ncbi:uncharacterized protein MONBRDRAFT_27239 [Monosiga brevicollis MX1]|uniref:Uncharacterized protein n=1 Tax=Monosiga brevicollis TaxID=81824 RepID=A9V4Q2_MONBE|nr:uncharacterized protein MONBRDRAFT_27239 [Monosiga brevicollis MX1]EDQ87409.1 predicted protein [Monosiga brevicollis MX1]|eukprot:XP_001747669.1 hypothetical protein [Monosiga brevicollis MX1]